MTKKEMIETIELIEQEQWELLCVYAKCFGEDSIETDQQRARWAAINVLCGKLGIDV